MCKKVWEFKGGKFQPRARKPEEFEMKGYSRSNRNIRTFRIADDPWQFQLKPERNDTLGPQLVFTLSSYIPIVLAKCERELANLGK